MKNVYSSLNKISSLVKLYSAVRHITFNTK